MRIRNRQDFWAGVMFTLMGAGFAFFARAYDFGGASRMGPGYFPTLLGLLLLVLGLLVAYSSTTKDNEETSVDPFGWREIFLILGSVIAFAATLPWLGMVGAVILLIFISAFASHEVRWGETILLTIGLVVMSYFVFVLGLELQFPVWPTFLTSH